MNLNFLHWQVVGVLKHPLAPCLPPSHLVKFSLSNCVLDYMVDFVFLNYNSPNCSWISLLTNISLLILTISFSVCSVQIILGCNVIHFTCNYAKYLIHRDLRWTLSEVYFTVLRFLVFCIAYYWPSERVQGKFAVYHCLSPGKIDTFLLQTSIH